MARDVATHRYNGNDTHAHICIEHILHFPCTCNHMLKSTHLHLYAHVCVCVERKLLTRKNVRNVIGNGDINDCAGDKRNEVQAIRMWLSSVSRICYSLRELNIQAHKWRSGAYIIYVCTYVLQRCVSYLSSTWTRAHMYIEFHVIYDFPHYPATVTRLQVIKTNYQYIYLPLR